MNIIDRRKFFNKVSLGAIGTILLSSFPLNLLGQTKKKSFKSIKIEIPQHSVKRNR